MGRFRCEICSTTLKEKAYANHAGLKRHIKMSHPNAMEEDKGLQFLDLISYYSFLLYS